MKQKKSVYTNVIEIGVSYRPTEEIMKSLAHKSSEEIASILNLHNIKSAIKDYYERLVEHEDNKIGIDKGQKRIYCKYCNFIICGCNCKVDRDLIFGNDGEDALNYLVGLFVEQNGKCTLTGLPLTFGQGGNASLDKIDAKGYYRKGNVHWTDKTINQMKRGYSVETFRQYAKLIK